MFGIVGLDGKFPLSWGAHPGRTGRQARGVRDLDAVLLQGLPGQVQVRARPPLRPR